MCKTGVYIDICRTWPKHDNIYKNPVSKKDYVHLCHLNFLLKILIQFFPHLNFYCTIWGNIKNKNCVNELCKLQKRVARVILNNIFIHFDQKCYNLIGCLLQITLRTEHLFLFSVLQGWTPNDLEFLNKKSTRLIRISQHKDKNSII